MYKGYNNDIIGNNIGQYFKILYCLYLNRYGSIIIFWMIKIIEIISKEKCGMRNGDDMMNKFINTTNIAVNIVGRSVQFIDLAAQRVR